MGFSLQVRLAEAGCHQFGARLQKAGEQLLPQLFEELGGETNRNERWPQAKREVGSEAPLRFGGFWPGFLMRPPLCFRWLLEAPNARQPPMRRMGNSCSPCNIAEGASTAKKNADASRLIENQENSKNHFPGACSKTLRESKTSSPLPRRPAASENQLLSWLEATRKAASAFSLSCLCFQESQSPTCQNSRPKTQNICRTGSPSPGATRPQFSPKHHNQPVNPSIHPSMHSSFNDEPTMPKSQMRETQTPQTWDRPRTARSLRRRTLRPQPHGWLRASWVQCSRSFVRDSLQTLLLHTLA